MSDDYLFQQFNRPWFWGGGSPYTTVRLRLIESRAHELAHWLVLGLRGNFDEMAVSTAIKHLGKGWRIDGNALDVTLRELLTKDLHEARTIAVELGGLAAFGFEISKKRLYKFAAENTRDCHGPAWLDRMNRRYRRTKRYKLLVKRFVKIVHSNDPPSIDSCYPP